MSEIAGGSQITVTHFASDFMGSTRKSCEAARRKGKRILRQLGKRYINKKSCTAAASDIKHPR